jgi:uncharacterized protein (TIGR02599 family)
MKTKPHTGAFTLVEVLVAASIVVVIMGVLLGMTDQTQRLVKSTSAKVEQFQGARVAFEAMTRHLAQATLNTFWDYKYSASTGVPTGYERKAELRFRSGPTKILNPTGGPGGNLQPGHGVFFQAPIGRVESTGEAAKKNKTPDLGALDHLMNTWGYFVEIGSNADKFPSFLQSVVNPRKRYRLMELMEPSEKMSVYKFQGDTTNLKWFSGSLSSALRPVNVLAENIVALIILPRLSLKDEQLISPNPSTPPVLAPNYTYDSTVTPASVLNATNQGDPKVMLLNTRNQLPPVVQVVMVAIDEPSARRLEDLYGSDSYLGVGYTPDPLSGQTLFTDPANLYDKSTGTAGDLTRLQNLLISRKVSFRVFSTNVTIKGAKWSLHTAN